MDEKTFEEVEVLIWTDPDTLSEAEIEQYLVVAEYQEKLDYENFLAALAQ